MFDDLVERISEKDKKGLGERLESRILLEEVEGFFNACSGGRRGVKLWRFGEENDRLPAWSVDEGYLFLLAVLPFVITTLSTEMLLVPSYHLL